MKWLNQKLINKSEVARQIGMNPNVFNMKLKNRNGNKFNECEIIRIEEVKYRLNNILK